ASSYPREASGNAQSAYDKRPLEKRVQPESFTPEIRTVDSANPTPSPSPSRGTMRRNHASEESFLAQLRNIYRGLPETHIQSLHNFALYLSEDAKAADKAEQILS